MISARERMAWVDLIDGEFTHVDLFARYTEVCGLAIAEIRMTDDMLVIAFVGGRQLTISDEGQSCCENRYMTCDDPLTGHEGGHLVHIEVSDAADASDDTYECHEVSFLKVQTTKGSITCSTHVEHNGYYGGFSIKVKLSD
jgi:hypothetical protein